MKKKEIGIGEKLFDEFGNEYKVEDIDINDAITLKKISKVVTGYVNIFYDKSNNQLTTGITYTDFEIAVNNGRVDTSYVKTIEINNQIEGEK